MTEGHLSVVAPYNTYTVPIDPAERPFTARLRELHDRSGVTYGAMETQCGRVCSYGWLQRLATCADPWKDHLAGRKPPSRSALPKLAKMMRVDEPTLRTWIAREWYGVETPDFSDRVKGLAPAIDALSDEAANAVGELMLLLARQEKSS